MAVTQGHGNPKWTRDETILALDLYFRVGGKVPGSDDAEVKALSALLRRSPFYPMGVRKDSFRNADGVAFKLQNIRSVATGKGLSNTSEMDQAIWSEFGERQREVAVLAEKIRECILEIGEEGDLSDELENEEIFAEGEIITAVHKRRERSPNLRKRKLAERRRSNQLFCDVCNTSSPWDESLPTDRIFECHHIVPLAFGQAKETSLGDVAFVCANCHRMIHAIIAKTKKWVTVEEAKAMRN